MSLEGQPDPHRFVTEFAGALTLTEPVGPAEWSAFSERAFADWRELLGAAFDAWGAWDGFDDALAAAATLP